MGNTLRIIEIIVGLGVLIMVHELGHFLAAKWAGVRVDKLALGMGPKIFAWGKGETEYSIRWIPVGGFCAMAGEEPGSDTSAPPERQFRQQPPGKRAIILLAGVVMNFILAIVMFSIAYGLGVQASRPIVGAVETGSPADQAGLRPGDEIVAVDGDTDVYWETIHFATLLSSEKGKFEVRVRRGDEEFTTRVGTVMDDVQGRPVSGMTPASGRTVEEVTEGGASEAAGLAVGDVIRTLDGMTFYYQGDVERYLSSKIGKTVKMVVERDGKQMTIDLAPRAAEKGSIGITPEGAPVVKAVLSGSPAEKAGMMEGDRITAVDGTTAHTAGDLVGLTSPRANEEVTYTVRRNDAEMTFRITPAANPGQHFGSIGVKIGDPEGFVVGEVAPGSPVAKAGIAPGDVLTEFNGKKLDKSSWGILQGALDAALRKKQQVEVAWKRGEATWNATLDVERVDDAYYADAGYSVSPTLTVMRKYPPWQAPVVGVTESWKMVRVMYLSLRQFATRRISSKGIAGPVGILTLSFKVAAEGISRFIWWLAFIGVNLVVVNLLPIPPFDGGLLVLTGIEKLIRRSISEKWLLRMQLAGWALVLVLIVFVTYNDIMRLVGSSTL